MCSCRAERCEQLRNSIAIIQASDLLPLESRLRSSLERRRQLCERAGPQRLLAALAELAKERERSSDGLSDAFLDEDAEQDQNSSSSNKARTLEAFVASYRAERKRYYELDLKSRHFCR